MYEFEKDIAMVIRWMLILFVTLIAFSKALPWLEKWGIGRLPGDLKFTLFGKVILLPFASTALLTMLLLLIGKFL